jgi:hypothetical protein
VKKHRKLMVRPLIDGLVSVMQRHSNALELVIFSERIGKLVAASCWISETGQDIRNSIESQIQELGPWRKIKPGAEFAKEQWTS